MDASKNNSIKWEDITYDHMNQYFWGCFATYRGKFARNKTNVNFTDGNWSASKEILRSLKKTKTAYSVKGSSQRCASTKRDILWKKMDNQKLSGKKANS